jgi:hypothetical protein
MNFIAFFKQLIYKNLYYLMPIPNKLTTEKLANLKVTPSSFHAGAETHIFANEKKNASSEAFVPVIAGLANLENIHSSDEKIDWQSFLAGRQWLEEIVTTFAEESIKEQAVIARRCEAPTKQSIH